jgi:hypothetical protein
MISWASMVATREPRPELLGLELEAFPYISAYGALLRVSRTMDLEPHEWYRVLGLKRSATPLDDLRPDRMSRGRFEEAIGVRQTQIPAYWEPEPWSPLRADGLLNQLSRQIRVCEKCAAYGYHTTLFQLPSITLCPWHGSPLSERCIGCKKPKVIQLDDEGRLATCDCGLDLFEVNAATVRMRTFPTELAERWLGSYLEWAAEQRKERWFVGSDRSAHWRAGFGQLAQPPPLLSAVSGWTVDQDTRVRQVELTPGPDPEAQIFWGWGALADDRPLTFVPLPPGTQSRLIDVTRRVVGGFPADTRTPLQLVANNGFDEQATLLQNAAQRPACFIALHGEAGDGSSWLRMSAVDLQSLQLCGKLLDCVLDACGAEPDDGDFSKQTARTQRLSQVPGRRHLAQALDEVLLQGYEQGLDALIRAALGQPPPDEWWQPVAEAVIGPEGLRRVVLCWIRSTAPRPAMEASPPPSPPTHRQRGRSPSGRRRSGRSGEDRAIRLA